MKFHLSTTTANVVTGFGPGWIRIGAQEYRENVILTPESVATGWARDGFDSLTEESFGALLAARPDAPGADALKAEGIKPEAVRPEVVILGTGATMRFPHPRLSRPLMAARVGLEIMDTAAACRTYNILAAEGRRVVAALMIDAACIDPMAGSAPKPAGSGKAEQSG